MFGPREMSRDAKGREVSRDDESCESPDSPSCYSGFSAVAVVTSLLRE